MKSFRARIILWTLSLTGAVLIAFGIVSDRAFYRIKLASVDERLKALAPPSFPSPEHKRFWDRYDSVVDEASSRLFGTDVVVVAYTEEFKHSIVLGEWAGSEGRMMDQLPKPRGILQARGVVDVPMPPEASERWLDERGRPGGGGPGMFRRIRGGREWSLPWGNGPTDDPIALELDGDDASWRFLVYENSGYNVAVGVPLDLLMSDVDRLRRAYYLAFPVALGVLALGAWFFSTRAIQPIRRLTVVAAGISAKSLDQRIVKSGEDREFASLIDVFNQMMERLESSFAQATRFSADAAHELKTPLSILQGNLENALQAAEDGSQRQVELSGLLEETQRLKSIVRKLLLLAQADAGRLPLKRESVDLERLVEEVIDDYVGLPDAPRFSWRQRQSARATCDKALISQALQNLISNAVKYRKEDSGEVTLSLRERDGWCVFEIENACEPLSESERSRLFDRFVRIDASRNRRVDGSGLGLSLSREFARAHGGNLTLAETEDRSTIRFTLALPVGDS